MAQLAAQDYFSRLQASGLTQLPFSHDLSGAFPQSFVNSGSQSTSRNGDNKNSKNSKKEKRGNNSSMGSGGGGGGGSGGNSGNSGGGGNSGSGSSGGKGSNGGGNNTDYKVKFCPKSFYIYSQFFSSINK